MKTKQAPEALSPVSKIRVPATAVVSGSILSGAMMSLSAFVIPVLLDTNSEAGQISRQWARLYHYGHIYLPALCIATCGLYIQAATSKRAMQHRPFSRYAVAAAATIAMVPFTWLVMAPTNNRLFQLEAYVIDPELGLVRALVVKWAWLHVARSLFPLLGAYLGFTGLLQEVGAQR